MDCSTPGFPVHHQLPEFAQTHVHWVGDAIQPSHPLSSPSPPAFNLSQHQGLFQWVGSFASRGQSTVASASASVLSMNSQGWFPLGLISLISLQSKGLSRIFSNTTVQKHQFFGAQLSLSAVSFQLSWFRLEMLRAWTNIVLVRLKRSDRFQRFSEMELTGIDVVMKVKKRRGHDGPERLNVDAIKNIVSFKGRKGF